MLSVLFCVLLLHFANAEATEPLTLDEAIRTGLKDSPLIRSNSFEAEASSLGKKAAMGQLLPQVNSYAGYTRLSDPSAVVPIKELGGTPPLFSRDHYSYGLAMKIPIFEGGRLWARLSAAEISEAISKETLHLSRQELIAGITNIFNRILYLEKLTQSQQATLNALKKAKADAKVRLSVGRIPEVDLMRMETQVAEQEQALVSAEEANVRARQLLSQMMGRDPAWSPQITGVLPSPSDSDPATKSTAISEMDLSIRPDIRRAMKQVELARAEVRQAIGYHLPSVDLVGDYGRRAGSGFEGDEEVWTGGIQLSMNIFSGGSAEAGVRQARAKLLAAEERLRNTRLNAMAEVASAISSLREARARYMVAEKNLSTAKETWRIEDLKYKAGGGTITDSLLAQSAWFQAEAGKLLALYEYHAAKVAWRLSTGIIDSDYQENHSEHLKCRNN